MRAILDYEDFKKYIHNGFVIKDGRKIWMKKSDIENLILGDVITQGDIEFILSDIGYPLIYKTLGNLNY